MPREQRQPFTGWTRLRDSYALHKSQPISFSQARARPCCGEPCGGISLTPESDPQWLCASAYAELADRSLRPRRAHPARFS